MKKLSKDPIIIIFSTLLISSLLSGCLNDINVDEPDLTKGLVAHFTFDETAGIIAKDDSVYKINSTVYGATWTNGKINGALDFDGINDFVQIPNKNSSPSDHFNQLKQGTISFWFKSDNIPTKNAVAPLLQYGKQTPSDVINNANGGLIIELGHDPLHQQSKRLYFTFFSNGCDLYPSLCYDSNYNLKEDKWYHYVAIVGYYNNIGYNTGYLNGKEMTNRHYNFGDKITAEFFNDAAINESFFLGKGFWDKEIHYFDGKLDDFRIYNRPLSSEEIIQLYNLAE